MKTLAFLVVLIFAFNSNDNSKQIQRDSTETDGALIKFRETNFEFKLTEGAIVKYSYVFDNIGSSTLEIKEVISSCDCIKTEFKATKIEPGTSSEITVTFDTKNEVGYHDVSITVATTATNQEKETLRFTGTVVK